MTTLRRRVLPSFALIAGLLGFILSAHAEQTLPVRVQITKVYKTTKGKKPARVVDPSKLKVKVSLEKASGPVEIESVQLPAGVSFQPPVGFPIGLRFPTKGKKLKKGTFSSVTWTLRAQGELAGTALLQVKKVDPAGSPADTIEVTLPQGVVATLQAPAAAPEAPPSPPVTTAPPPTPSVTPPAQPAPPPASTAPTVEPQTTAPAVKAAPVPDPAAAARQARYDNFSGGLAISAYLHAGPGVLLPSENSSNTTPVSSQLFPLYRPLGIGWMSAGGQFIIAPVIWERHSAGLIVSAGGNWMPQKHLQSVGLNIGVGLEYCHFGNRAVCLSARFTGVGWKSLGDAGLNLWGGSLVPSVRVEVQVAEKLYLGIEPSFMYLFTEKLPDSVGFSFPLTVRWNWSLF